MYCQIYVRKSSFTAQLTRRCKTKFPTIYPTIYLPKWKFWIQLSPKWYYGKCLKISNTSCLSKRARQTEQTQIRLLLKKQSDQGLPCLLFWWLSVNSSPNNHYNIWKQKEESVWNFWIVTVQDNQDIFQASSCPLAQDNTYRRRAVWERV